MSGRVSEIRLRRLADTRRDRDFPRTTPAQRLAMVWQLTLDAWAFMGEPVAEPRLPRHIVRVIRRAG